MNVLGCEVEIRRGGTGAPLLFLHGAQGTAEWDRGLAALAGHFDVIAPDLPGFGRSGVCDRVDDMSDLAWFMLDVLDELNLTGVHLAGECIGGWLAMEMALRAPGRFASLSLVNSAGIRIKGVPRADMFICNEPELMRLLFAGTCGEEWQAQWTASAEAMDAHERNAAAAARFAWQPRLCSLTLDRWLHRIAAPTLVIWGEQNRIIPAEYAAALGKLIPGARVSMLAECGHLAHFEQPRALAGAIARFTQEVAQ